MNKLPRNIKPQPLIKFLIKLGFKEGKGKGSHIRLIHPKPIPEGTLRKIIRQARITDEQLKDLK